MLLDLDYNNYGTVIHECSSVTMTPVQIGQLLH